MDQFARTEIMLGKPAMEILKNSRVAVFGLGGVGGYVVEALARAGVGHLDLVDHDTVSLTNLNRQILATHSTIGMAKTEAARNRVADISPDTQVTVHETFFLPETRAEFPFEDYSYVVDAVDTVTAKLALAVACQEAGTPIISSMGTGNKLDPTGFRVADITETSGCHLARIIRRECKKRGIRHLKVVYSPELPAEPKGISQEAPPEGRNTVPGSLSFVPPVAGLILAGQVIRDLTGI